MQKLKDILQSKITMVEVGTFILLKIFMGIMELPHYPKSSSEIPFLIIALILTVLCIVMKLYNHKYELIRSIIHIQKEIFLLWIVTTIFIIFSWSLCDALNWSFFEKLLVVLCEILQTFLISLLTDFRFISKIEFYGFEATIGLNIIALAIKTVGFIKDDSESAHKDIVLLNLSTQIALAIIMMDILERSYSTFKAKERSEDMSRIENQLPLTK